LPRVSQDALQPVTACGSVRLRKASNIISPPTPPVPLQCRFVTDKTRRLVRSPNNQIEFSVKLASLDNLTRVSSYLSLDLHQGSEEPSVQHLLIESREEPGLGLHQHIPGGSRVLWSRPDSVTKSHGNIGGFTGPLLLSEGCPKNYSVPHSSIISTTWQIFPSP